MKKQTVIIHNFLLPVILASGLLLFYLNRGFYLRQLNIAVAVSVLYVLWGLIYHYLRGDLHLRIVIEYCLIAVLAVIILRGALLR